MFDPAVDAQNMNRLIADKPDLIISVPASASAIVPSYIRAKAAGIPILGAIGRQSADGAKIVTAEARTDDPSLGRFAAMNLVEGMTKAGFKSGNVIALTGTASQNNVTDRMAAFNAYMKKFPQYKVVAIEDTNWDQATSAKVAQQLFSKYASKGGIQGAYGMADNMAVGIIQGAKQAGVKIGVAKKGLVITGSNCLAVGINAIKSGQQYGTGTQAPQVEAALAVKVAARHPQRQDSEPEGAVRPGAAHHRRRTWPSSRRSAPSSETRSDSMSGERDPAALSPGSRPPSDDRPVLLEVVGLSKSYGPVRAVRGLSLDVRVGEVHAICGHNGAGKSTLVKALVGLVKPDEGVIRFDGQELSLRNPHEAQAHGIALVNQELSLVPELSVEDNIFLGGLDVPLLYRRRRLSEHARGVLDQLGLRHVQLGTPVETLSIGERQLVEIARLLVRDARLLILDEPTATLSKPEIERVFRATRDLVAQGRSVIFVSHRLDEVFELCDRVTVLRDGDARRDARDPRDRPALADRAHARRDGGSEDRRSSTSTRCPGPAPRWSGSTGSTCPAASTRCRSRSRAGSSPASRDRSAPARARSCARSAGSSRTPPARSRCNGEKVLLSTPRRAADAGVLYIPNDRQREGLFLGQTVERNLTVTRLRRLSRLGVLLRRRIQRSARELAAMTAVPVDRLGSPAGSLSGGNQQKVLLGRALQLDGTALLALDEPTRGVDVGGRAEIHNLVREAARKGTAVIFSSTELDEVLDLADVVVTIFAGRIVSVVPRAEASASAILADMTTSHAARQGDAAS